MPPWRCSRLLCCNVVFRRPSLRRARSGRPTAFELQTAYGWSTSHLGGSKATSYLLDLLELEPGCSVLDLGCGPGDTACAIASECACSVVGIDASQYQIAVGRSRAHTYGLSGRVSFLVGDVQHLPFDSHSFDRILVQSVVALVPDTLEALRECARVLKGSGRIGINEVASGPGVPPKPTTARLAAAGHRHVTPRSPEQWRNLLASAGLDVDTMYSSPGLRTRDPAHIAAATKYYVGRICRVLLANWGHPENWHRALLFLDLFRAFAFRQPPYVLCLAVKRDGHQVSEPTDCTVARPLVERSEHE